MLIDNLLCIYYANKQRATLKEDVYNNSILHYTTKDGIQYTFQQKGDFENILHYYDYYKDRTLKYEERAVDNRYTVCEYDLSGNLSLKKVTKNSTSGTERSKTTYSYDALNRLEYVYEWNNGSSSGVGSSPYATTSYRNNLTSQTDARNLTTFYTYDSINRLTKVTYPNDDYVAYGYDDLNNKTKEWTSERGSEYSPAISYSYDDLQRVTQISYSGGTYVGYTYDDASNPKTLTIGSNYNVTYTYDEISRLIKVRDNLTGKEANYLYYNGGQLDKVDFPNNTYSNYVIDKQNRVKKIYHKNSNGSNLVYLIQGHNIRDNPISVKRYDSSLGRSKFNYFYYDDLSRIMSPPAISFYVKNDTNEGILVVYRTKDNLAQFPLEPGQEKPVSPDIPEDLKRNVTPEQLRRMFLKFDVLSEEGNAILDIESFRQRDIELVEKGMIFKYILHIRNHATGDLR